MLMGDKWMVLIVSNLLSGIKRFSELKKLLNSVSQKVLMQHLRAIEKKWTN